MADTKTASQVLSDEQRDQFVAELIESGTEFAAPLYAVVDSIEHAVVARRPTPPSADYVRDEAVAGEWSAVIREKLERFAECAEDSDNDGVDISRQWFDALTTIGLLRRVQRSPAHWEMTEAGETMLAAAPTPPVVAADEPVLWQWRKKGTSWSLSRTFYSEVHATTDDSEVRALYARPQQAASALVAGCHRSHPHENMNAECEGKTVEARATNEQAASDGRHFIGGYQELPSETLAPHADNCASKQWDEVAFRFNMPQPKCDCDALAPTTAPTVVPAGEREAFEAWRRRNRQFSIERVWLDACAWQRSAIASDETFEEWFDETSGFTHHDEAVAHAAWKAAKQGQAAHPQQPAGVALTDGPVYQEQGGNGMWQDVSKELYEGRVAGKFRGGAIRTLYARPQQAASKRDAANDALEKAAQSFERFFAPTATLDVAYVVGSIRSLIVRAATAQSNDTGASHD